MITPCKEEVNFMRLSQSFSTAVLLGLLVMGLGNKCFADSVMYSNLGTGSGVYNGDQGWNVIGAANPSVNPLSQYAPAFSFTPASTAYFTQLDMAMAHVNGTNSATVDLMTDESGPGTVLESWSVSGLQINGTCCTLLALSGNGTILLESGMTYWVAALPGDSLAFDSWEYDSTGVTGTVFENEGTGWALYSNGVTDGAFEVQGEASTIPEPGTPGLFGSGLLGLIGLLRRRSRQ
jgi:hypothetical protein